MIICSCFECYYVTLFQLTQHHSCSLSLTIKSLYSIRSIIWCLYITQSTGSLIVPIHPFLASFIFHLPWGSMMTATSSINRSWSNSVQAFSIIYSFILLTNLFILFPFSPLLFNMLNTHNIVWWVKMYSLLPRMNHAESNQ